MHTGPADACAWAHPRWGRAAGDQPRRLPVFEHRTDVAGGHSMQVVREQALRERSGTEAAPALVPLNGGKAKGPAPCGNRASDERGRSASAGSFTRCVDVITVTTEVVGMGDLGRQARQLRCQALRHPHGIAPALRAGGVDDGDEKAVHGEGLKAVVGGGVRNARCGEAR